MAAKQASNQAYEEALGQSEPDDILAALERTYCIKNEKPAPEGILTLEKWKEWVKNASEIERRAWMMDAYNFAIWLIEHKAEKKVNTDKKFTLTMPSGFEELSLVIVFIVGDDDRLDKEGILVSETNAWVSDSPYPTLALGSILSALSMKDGPTFDEAVKGAWAAWVSHEKEYLAKNKDAKNPFGASIEAYVLLRRTAIEPFKPKKRGSLPRFDKIEAGEAKTLIQLQPEPPPDSQLFLEFPELQRTGAASWLLNLYDKVGGAANQRGRGAPWSMRLFIGGLLHVPIDQRDGEGHYFPVPTDEVIRWLYPNGKWTSKYSRWESFTEALKEVNRLGWISVPDVGSVHVFGVSVIPEKPSDPFVEFIARVPSSAAHGARIDWPKLCAYGKESAPLYRAYLTACEFMHSSANNGQPVTEVIGEALTKPDGTLIRKKGGKAVRSQTEFVPNPAVRYVTGLTKAQLTKAIGLDASSRSNQAATMKAFEQLAADDVIDLQKKGRGQYQKFFLFAPNQWAEAHAKTLEKEQAEQNTESNTTAYKK